MQLLGKTLLSTILFSSLALAQLPTAPETGSPSNTTGALGDAKTYYEDPNGKSYVADFKATKLGGTIKFSPQSDGNGVKVDVALSGFPLENGPFSYHVHDQPVPSDGNCTLTKAHLDPYIRGQKIPCDPTRPASCEVGDLAGKHGKIPDTTGNTTYLNTYVDNYITLNQGVAAFIGNRSVVVHLADGKRYACANITLSTVPPPTVPYTNGGSSSLKNPGYWGCGLGAAVGLKFLLV